MKPNKPYFSIKRIDTHPHFVFYCLYHIDTFIYNMIYFN